MASTPAVMAPPPALKYQRCNNVDGLVSVEALRIIVETKACFVAVALALAYFLTASRHRLWSSSHLIKGFLFAVTQPVTRFLVSMFAMLLSMPFRNDLYLLWGILLLAGYEGVYTISGYGVSARLSDLAVHEFTRCSNIVVLGLYVRYYSNASQFRYPLWALWALMVAKFLERIVRFKIANKRYGDGNISRVAQYMKHEHKLSESSNDQQSSSESSTDTEAAGKHELSGSTSTDIEAGEQGFHMKNYNYLIVGDSKLDGEKNTTRGIYEPELKPVTHTVTVAKVWEYPGNLLGPDKKGRYKLKDVCLSFALCKLLRRKFAGVEATKSELRKARKLVFDGLITSDIDEERTFRVIRAELGFARDISFTKYPILFSCGFPVISVVLFAATLGVSIWIIVSAILHYRVPRGSSPNLVHGKNVDLSITFGIVSMVTAMDICEFSMHLSSNWTKVMVISEYVRNRYGRCYLLDRIIWLVCCGNIAEPIGNSLGQFNLVYGAKRGCIPTCVIKVYHAARSFVLLNNDGEYRIMKGKTIRVPDEVKKAICQTLMANKTELTQGKPLPRTASMLQRYGRHPTAIETIVVWHVATCHLQKLVDESQRKSYEVATRLSKYCAYLLFYKPKLLGSVGNNSVRYTCKTLVQEAAAARGSGSGSGDDNMMMRKGKALADKLKARGRVDWTELAEFWSELLISLAPSGSVSAHEKGLGDGGEFITHLWALLYHAGIDDKFTWSTATGSTAGGDSGGTADNSTFQNGTAIVEPHTVSTA
ncbi:hypothetical protein OsI_09962 [Oryza sativa Indica Group]|nr:hypothetical protein OsI_09962 [Oryza sativa Indica Group]